MESWIVAFTTYARRQDEEKEKEKARSHRESIRTSAFHWYKDVLVPSRNSSSLYQNSFQPHLSRISLSALLLFTNSPSPWQYSPWKVSLLLLLYHIVWSGSTNGAEKENIDRSCCWNQSQCCLLSFCCCDSCVCCMYTQTIKRILLMWVVFVHFELHVYSCVYGRKQYNRKVQRSRGKDTWQYTIRSSTPNHLEATTWCWKKIEYTTHENYTQNHVSYRTYIHTLTIELYTRYTPASHYFNSIRNNNSHRTAHIDPFHLCLDWHTCNVGALHTITTHACRYRIRKQYMHTSTPTTTYMSGPE